MEYLCATYWIQLMFLTVTSLTVHCYIIRHNSYYALIPYPTMLNFCHRIVHTCAYFCYRMIVLVQMIRFFNTRGEMFLWHKSSFQLLVYRVFFSSFQLNIYWNWHFETIGNMRIKTACRMEYHTVDTWWIIIWEKSIDHQPSSIYLIFF